VPARAPSGRMKRAGKIDFILAIAALELTQYARKKK
jgi:hypothetical protein